MGLAALTRSCWPWLVPRVPADRGASGRTELRALKEPQVLLTALAGAIGFGGMFAIYTYIAPTVTEVAGQREGMVPVYLLAFGVGSVLGTLVGGRLADWSILRSTVLGAAAMGLLLAAYAVTSQWLVLGMVTVFLISARVACSRSGCRCGSSRSRAGRATLGAALNHSALNTANALGAWLGGLVVAAGLGYPSTAWVGVGLSLLGLLVLGASVALQRRTTLAAAAA